MKRFAAVFAVLFGCLGSLVPSIGMAQSTQLSAQSVLEKAQSEQRHTFLIFYRDDNTTTRSMGQVVSETLKKRPDNASATYVQISNPRDKVLVDRYGVSRAPMPLVVAVAPNGAMTGIFSGKVSGEQLASTFVTPSKAECMKAIQAGKLVLLCTQTNSNPSVPQSVRDFQADSQFRDRIVVINFPITDSAETDFVRELQLDSKQPSQVGIVFMAPPGVLVGKFPATAKKDDMATALHKAGKCCDDPNCKHNHSGPTKR